jgi:hypothetical protein
MSQLDEQQLAELIATLAPAPEAWVRAAQALPAARQAIDSLVARAQADGLARERILGDLEESLRREGVDPDRSVLEQLRVRLGQDPPL